MNLHELNQKVQASQAPHRVGRGPGSGWGCTAGRGNNGALARSGYKRKLHSEGGQMPFVRRIAKRGFSNAQFKKVWAFVNLRDLNAFADGDVVTAEECLKRGLIPKIRSGLKVLGVGTLEKTLTIKAHRVSAKAREAIEGKGGTIDLIPHSSDNAKSRWKEKRHNGKSRRRRDEAQRRG